MGIFHNYTYINKKYECYKIITGRLANQE